MLVIACLRRLHSGASTVTQSSLTADCRLKLLLVPSRTPAVNQLCSGQQTRWKPAITASKQSDGRRHAFIAFSLSLAWASSVLASKVVWIAATARSREHRESDPFRSVMMAENSRPDKQTCSNICSSTNQHCGRLRLRLLVAKNNSTLLASHYALTNVFLIHSFPSNDEVPHQQQTATLCFIQPLDEEQSGLYLPPVS